MRRLVFYITRPRYYFTLVILMLTLTSCISNRHDSVKRAKTINEKTCLIDKKITDFLVEEIDTRRFLMEAGQLATEQSDSEQIKLYGELMVRDQFLMIKEIATIAACRKITLPETLSKSKIRILKALKSKEAQNFDAKFSKLFISNNRYNLREFEKATSFEDRYVRIFARRYLPMIQMHLGKIKQINEGDNIQDSIELITVVSN